MVRFGVQFWQEKFDIDGLRNACREAENMGFESAWLYDHFYPMSTKTGWNIYEPWTILPLLAAETSRIRLGVLVTGNSYRFPPVLAKIAATVDVICNGRLEFGIGAGWYQTEYEAYGIPFPTAGIRIEQLAEAVVLIKSIWTEDEASFHGKHYVVRNLVSEPKPIQKPHPPIWIGGKGDTTLRVVALHADYANLASCSVMEFRDRMELLRKICAETGRNFKSIEKTWHGVTIVADEKQAKRRALTYKRESANRKIREMSDETFLSRSIIGTSNQCIEKIQKYIEEGATYFIPHFPFSKNLSGQRLFKDEVASSFI
jgi:F420-dependent oxidoreductase-like protein